MQADSGVPLAELRVDGGATENGWLMEFQAGILGVPVHRAAIVETTAFGAAGLAGVTGGVWKDPLEFLNARTPATVFEPAMSEARRRELRRGWTRAVRAALAWTLDEGGEEG
jgi:glycerol kinase